MTFDTKIEFIPNDAFGVAEPDSMLILPGDQSLYADRSAQDPIDIDETGDFDLLQGLPLLSADGETFLFRKMNYLLFLAERLRCSTGDQKSDTDIVSRCQSYLRDAEAVRNHIAECNLRLVMSLSRKFANSVNDFDDLMSQGSEILLKAIAKFDYSRGFRFSTYATHAVQRHFFRYVHRSRKQRSREAVTPAEILSDVPQSDVDEMIAEWIQEEYRMGVLLRRMAERLDERETIIVKARFGLDNSGVKTLRELSDDLKLSKERVRQLQLSAISKLKELFQEIDPQPPPDRRSGS